MAVTVIVEDGDHRMAVERSGNLERYTAIRENEKRVIS